MNDVLFHVLLALATIIAVGRALGWAVAHAGQPPVIGEVVAGIVLGPSLLGRFSPETMAYVFPNDVLPHLGVLAQLGVIVYMFLVGLDLNGKLVRARVRQTLIIAHAGILVPFLLGIVLALPLFGAHAPEGVGFTTFALFMGVALAITAFPVLARILTDRRMEKTDLGVLALACAAVGDVSAWCLLAVTVGVAQAHLAGALLTVVLAVVFVGVMLGVIGPLAARWMGRYSEDALPPHVLAGVLVALLLSALATEAIGIHAIFGAFLFGAVIPHDCAIARVCRTKLEDVVAILLLPAFFAIVGMRTEIGLVDGWDQWLLCGGIILAATAGKVGGTFVAARLTGIDGRTAAALGILMNTRGLMELIVLNIGLDLGIISPALFAMLVLMALATTMLTTPALQWLSAATPAAQADRSSIRLTASRSVSIMD